MMNRIKELRKQKNLTLKKLSESLKEKGLSLSADSLSKYERGARNPKIENWVKLSKFFDVSVAYLKGEKQKNCPYCHDRANLLQSNDERPVDGDMVYINKDGYLNLKTDWGHVYRMANYCPMCGRDLRSDEKFHQTYRKEDSNGESIDKSPTSGD